MAQIDKIMNKIDKYLFNFQQRESNNIHSSIISSKALCFIRSAIFIYMTGAYVFQLLVYKSFLTNIIHLTDVGYFFTWSYFTSTLQDHLFHGGHTYKFRKSTSENLKNYIEIMFYISFCIEFPITAIYWTALYHPSNFIKADEMFRDINVHALPLLFIIIDFVFNVFSFPRRHLLCLFIFGFLYIVVNLSYSLAVEPVYDVIDWVSYSSYAFVAGAGILILGIYTFGHYIYVKCKKDKVKCKQRSSERSSSTSIERKRRKSLENKDIYKDTIIVDDYFMGSEEENSK